MSSFSMAPEALPIIVQILLACGLAGAIFVVSHLLGQRGRPNKLKDSPYECGVESHVEPIGPFSVKFYRIAVLFILFDVALCFLIPWALSFKEAAMLGIKTLLPAVMFVGFLSLALFYVIKRGALDWEK